MDNPSLLALLIWLTGVPIAAWLASRWLPKLVDQLKEAEQEAMAEAMAPNATRGDARVAREWMERMHDNRYAITRTLEALSASGRLPLAYLIIGAVWPGHLVISVVMFLRAVLLQGWNLVAGTWVECDACGKSGPWGWTFRRAQAKAVTREGWVATPDGEDLCRGCALSEGIPLS